MVFPEHAVVVSCVSAAQKMGGNLCSLCRGEMVLRGLKLCDRIEMAALCLRHNDKGSAEMRNEKLRLAENDMVFFETQASRANFDDIRHALLRLESIAAALEEPTTAARAETKLTASARRAVHEEERRRLHQGEERAPVTWLRFYSDSEDGDDEDGEEESSDAEDSSAEDSDEDDSDDDDDNDDDGDSADG